MMSRNNVIYTQSRLVYYNLPGDEKPVILFGKLVEVPDGYGQGWIDRLEATMLWMQEIFLKAEHREDCYDITVASYRVAKEYINQRRVGGYSTHSYKLTRALIKTGVADFLKEINNGN